MIEKLREALEENRDYGYQRILLPFSCAEREKILEEDLYKSLTDFAWQEKFDGWKYLLEYLMLATEDEAKRKCNRASVPPNRQDAEIRRVKCTKAEKIYHHIRNTHDKREGLLRFNPVRKELFAIILDGWKYGNEITAESCCHFLFECLGVPSVFNVQLLEMIKKTTDERFLVERAVRHHTLAGKYVRHPASTPAVCEAARHIRTCITRNCSYKMFEDLMSGNKHLLPWLTNQNNAQSETIFRARGKTSEILAEKFSAVQRLINELNGISPLFDHRCHIRIVGFDDNNTPILNIDYDRDGYELNPELANLIFDGISDRIKSKYGHYLYTCGLILKISIRDQGEEKFHKHVRLND